MRRSKKAMHARRVEEAEAQSAARDKALQGVRMSQTVVPVMALPRGAPVRLLQPITVIVGILPAGYWLATTTVTERLGGAGGDANSAITTLLHAMVDRYIDLLKNEQRLAPEIADELRTLGRYFALGMDLEVLPK